MGKVIRAEIYKMLHGKALYIMIGTAVLAGICTAINIWSAFSEVSWNGFDFTKAMYDYSSQYTGYAIIFLLIIVAIYIATEFSSDTIKNILFIGTSRTSFVLVKLIICELVFFITLLVMLIAQCLSVKIFAGNKIDVSMLEYAKMTIILTLKFNLLFIPNLVITAFFACLSQNPIATIALGYGFGVLQSIVVLALESFGFEKVVEKIFLIRMECFSNGSHDDKLYIACIAGAVWLVVLTILTIIYMRRKDMSAR